MTIALIILGLLSLFIIVAYYLFIRFFWIIRVVSSWAIIVTLYCEEKKESPDEYMELWPVSYFYTHFWKWQLRDFIVNQDKFDEVVKYWIENLRKMQKKH